MFQMYVKSVSYGCCKSRLGCCICCKYFRGTLQAFVQSVLSVLDVCCKYFDLDVAYVSHICCKSMFQIFQLFHSYVAVSIFMLQVFYLFQTLVASVLIWMLHMFHTYVARVCFKSFICFSLMLQQVFSCCKLCFI